jgi:hypothetical protein
MGPFLCCAYLSSSRRPKTFFCLFSCGCRQGLEHAGRHQLPVFIFAASHLFLLKDFLLHVDSFFFILAGGSRPCS